MHFICNVLYCIRPLSTSDSLPQTQNVHHMHQKELDNAIGGDPLRQLDQKEKELILHYKVHCTQIAGALPKFLQCVNWADLEEVAEMHYLLGKWTKITKEVPCTPYTTPCTTYLHHLPTSLTYTTHLHHSPTPLPYTTPLHHSRTPLPYTTPLHHLSKMSSYSPPPPPGGS